jgi:hypothetical protein
MRRIAKSRVDAAKLQAFEAMKRNSKMEIKRCGSTLRIADTGKRRD